MADSHRIGAVASADHRQAMSVDRGNSRVRLRVYAGGTRPLVAEIELDEFCAVLLIELLQTAITRAGTHGAGPVNRG